MNLIPVRRSPGPHRVIEGRSPFHAFHVKGVGNFAKHPVSLPLRLGRFFAFEVLRDDH
jgi:hypothetical protein